MIFRGEVENALNPRSYYERIFELLEAHHLWFKRSIPLIASENVPSSAVREAIISDFCNRYAEGWPGDRVYAGCKYLDEVEVMAMELAKKLYNADFADVRPISGVVANLVLYTVFTEPGDHIFALPIPRGGHISAARRKFKGTAGAVRGLNVNYFAYDEEELNIDVDRTIKRINALAKKGVKPKLALFGASVFLFPHPIKELADVFHSLDAVVAYDASHVAGLIAGGCFQKPFEEGVDVISMSTHKTLPGPQHGMILSVEKYGDLIKNTTFPALVSNHHLHNVAGLAVALAEMLAFGRTYASQIVRNAKALAQALYERGFKVLGEKKGFTASHTILIDVSEFGGGAPVEAKLEEANIFVNRNLLPWDVRLGRHYKNPGGMRLGVSEVTRLGMRENEMVEIADFIKSVIIDGKDPKAIREKVAEFRRSFQRVHYCFDNALEAYEYVKLRK